MKHVSILIPDGNISISNIEGTWHILSEVNLILEKRGMRPLFNLNLVGLSAAHTQPGGKFIIKPDLIFHEVKKTDLIIIPAVNGNQQLNISNNKALLPWIINQHQSGAEVASYCVGAFLLAATGLLSKKPCASHWQAAGEFRRMFPDVELMDDKVLMEWEGIYTSGGANSYLNLLVYIIEKYAGREIAILISKIFAIDKDRISQSQFLIFEGQKAHNDKLVKAAQEFIELNFEKKLSIELLCSALNTGRRNFERRFKKATANSVLVYIQRVKIEAAKKNMETTQMSIIDVMNAVGYQDVKAFRDIFKRLTGLSPLGYRKKYQRKS